MTLQMIGGQLSAPRRVVQSFPDDRGLQKTSTYIVPCFLFVEVSVLLKREPCTAAMMACWAHQTWLTAIWKFHPDLIWMLNSTTKGGICHIYPDVTSIFVLWCLCQLCAWLSVKAGRDEALALNSAGVGDFGNRWELGSHEGIMKAHFTVFCLWMSSSSSPPFPFFRHFTRFSRQISNNERHLGNCVN